MTTLDDLATAIVSRCTGSSQFVAAIPGGAWLDRADESAAKPYAVFRIEAEGPTQRQTDGQMVQNYSLKMAVYSDQGLAGNDPQAIQLAMADAIPVTGWAALRSGVILHCLPRPFSGSFNPRLRNSRDVFVSMGQWAMLTAGTSTP